MVKLYTFVGDKGETNTLSGIKIPKDDPTIMINGEIDSLQASLDRVIAYSNNNSLIKKEFALLSLIQTKLWQLGGEVSQHKIGGKVNDPITESDVLRLQDRIDQFNLNLTGFVRFNNFVSIDINESRVRARKVERLLTATLRKKQINPISYTFINRLSDYLFGLAVIING